MENKQIFFLGYEITRHLCQQTTLLDLSDLYI